MCIRDRCRSPRHKYVSHLLMRTHCFVLFAIIHNFYVVFFFSDIRLIPAPPSPPQQLQQHIPVTPPQSPPPSPPPQIQPLPRPQPIYRQQQQQLFMRRDPRLWTPPEDALPVFFDVLHGTEPRTHDDPTTMRLLLRRRCV